MKIKDYLVDLEVNNINEVKILQLTDFHIAYFKEIKIIKKYLDNILNKVKPNLIVITGDIFFMAISEEPLKEKINIVKETVKLIDSYNIPFTITYGNHDDEANSKGEYISKKDLSRYFLESKNILFKDLDDNIKGSGNFCLNLKYQKQVFYSLYFLDSHSNNDEGYDYISSKQIKLYKKLVKINKTKSLLFFHITLVEYKEAYNKYLKGEIKGFGINKENVSCSKTNNNFFKVIKRLKSTEAIFVGHDHNNNAKLLYQGIWLCYGLKTGHYCYYDKELLGGTLIKLNPLDIKDIYVKEVLN